MKVHYHFSAVAGRDMQGSTRSLENVAVDDRKVLDDQASVWSQRHVSPHERW
jgi:hypothetical protein